MPNLRPTWGTIRASTLVTKCLNFKFPTSQLGNFWSWGWSWGSKLGLLESTSWGQSQNSPTPASTPCLNSVLQLAALGENLLGTSISVTRDLEKFQVSSWLPHPSCHGKVAQNQPERMSISLIINHYHHSSTKISSNNNGTTTTTGNNENGSNNRGLRHRCVLSPRYVFFLSFFLALPTIIH